VYKVIFFIPEQSNSGIEEVDDEGELGFYTSFTVSSSVTEKSDLYFSISAIFLLFLEFLNYNKIST